MKSNPRVDFGLLVLRIGLGLILIYFGAQKLFGVFGGPGPKAIIDAFHKGYGIPTPLTILAMVAEFFGGLGLIVGLGTSLAAFGIACTMGVATYFNWRSPGAIEGALNGNGADAASLFFSLSLFVAAVAVTIMGGGSISLDSKLFGKSKGRRK